MRDIPLKIGKREQSVNYFVNLRAECHFPKIGCSESSLINTSTFYDKCTKVKM